MKGEVERVFKDEEDTGILNLPLLTHIRSLLLLAPSYCSRILLRWKSNSAIERLLSFRRLRLPTSGLSGIFLVLNGKPDRMQMEC